jgi:hypothetical protein
MGRITRDLQRQIHKQLHDVECITSQLAAGDLVNPDRLETEELRLATLLACLEAQCAPASGSELTPPEDRKHRPPQQRDSLSPTNSTLYPHQSAVASGASSELEQPQPLASMALPSAFDSAASSELVSPQPLASDPAPSALASTFCPAQQFVTTTATAQYPIMERTDIAKCLMQPNFGERMCQPQYGDKIDIYNYVAGIAMSHNQFKYTALQSKLWSLRPRSEWLSQAINLTDRSERPSFHCIPNIYKYTDTLPETLIVDFANRTVGGGCFNRGFVQEEQIVAQSNDFTIRLHKHRQRLFSYQGVYMDACWSRDAAEKKTALRLTDIHAQRSNPLTILAVDAPSMHAAYCSDDLQMLAAKILIIFAAAEQLNSPQIFSGLLGGGAFRNNRPLVLLLHLLLQPRSSTRPMLFHHPVFWSFSDFSKHALETNIVSRADTMLKALRAQNVTTLGHALSVIYDWGLTLSEHDMDLI